MSLFSTYSLNKQELKLKMKKHFNIAVFIPHLGCKNDCVFCNQKIITGTQKKADMQSVKNTIEEYISAGKRAGTFNIAATENEIGAEIEIAFFGGSFTGLDRNEMIGFLKIANEYVGCENITGIRLSTRPDYITDEILDILMRYNVKAVELGVQSMFDDVLAASKRGHTVEDTIKACSLINERGIALTGQMMLGLPESDREKDIDTAKRLAELKIQSARVYPTIVFRDTELYEMYISGKYTPICLEEAVYRAKEIKKIYDSNNIKILRMGLCASDNMSADSADLYIGPYHPAFGELVESEVIFDRLCGEIEDKLKSPAADGVGDINIEITTEKNNISKIIGHKKKNILRLKEKFGAVNIKICEEYKVKAEKKESVTWVCSIN